ncbi:SDR family oxidoreductase [Aquisalimonas sp.]|uniref:SDR family oxidoreductase n=1 Tax=Aquisalimonas sp. TaxID=1872621 RepID=UPI0025C7170F|nr:SDR family oxidoreductase [Aquisalimonas sp.]
MRDMMGYYEGQTLLLTGATGFLGKVLLETILRNLPEVKKIYVLLRPRGNGSAQNGSSWEALQARILNTSAFERLRERHGRGFDAFAKQRLEPVAGDLSRPALGLEPAVYARIRGEVDVVINSGALAVFDAPLDEALQSNALAPLRALELAQGAPRAPLFVHVSTCYVNNAAGPAFETPLDPRTASASAPSGNAPLDAEREVEALLEQSEQLRNGSHSLETARKRLVDHGLRRARAWGWNDTYTFTKALGEQLLERHRGNVPTLILRPSIIESALRTPAPGWIDGFRMMDPVIVGMGRGLITEFPGNPDTVLDVVPVDAVANALLMAVPSVHSQSGREIFHVATGMERPLLVKDCHTLLADYFERYPLRRNGEKRRLPDFAFPDLDDYLLRLDYRYLYPLAALEPMLTPLARTTWGRRKGIEVKARRSRLQRLRHIAATYGRYAAGRTRFVNFNTKALWDGLSERERELFPFCLEGLDWRRYLHEVHLPGIENYLLHMHRTQPKPLDAHVPRRVTARERAGGDAGKNGARWGKASQLIALTRKDPSISLHGWRAPGYLRALKRTNFAMMRMVAKHYLRLQCSGWQHVPQKGPFIVAANHSSHIDTGVLLCALGSRAHKVHPIAAADYWFRNRMLSWVLHASLEAIPFDRWSRNIPKSISLPVEVLRQGHSLIFYPEGSRSPDGEMQPFKNTVGLLVLASGAPILPAYVSGTHQALPKGKALMRPHPVRVHFGPVTPVEPYLQRLETETVSSVTRGLAQDARAKVAKLKEYDDDETMRVYRTDNPRAP